MLFAYLKRILGPGRLRLRGPCGASDEFLLPAITQNLRKLAKIFPAPPHPQKARSKHRVFQQNQPFATLIRARPGPLKRLFRAKGGKVGKV